MMQLINKANKARDVALAEIAAKMSITMDEADIVLFSVIPGT